MERLVEREEQLAVAFRHSFRLHGEVGSDRNDEPLRAMPGEFLHNRHFERLANELRFLDVA